MSNTIINVQVLKLKEINNSVPFYHRYLLLHSPLSYSDEYSGRDSSEERSKRRARKSAKNRKSGRERSVSATRPRVHIGGTGIEESNRSVSS